jgi:hypothetical protein
VAGLSGSRAGSAVRHRRSPLRQSLSDRSGQWLQACSPSASPARSGRLCEPKPHSRFDCDIGGEEFPEVAVASTGRCNTLS